MVLPQVFSKTNELGREDANVAALLYFRVITPRREPPAPLAGYLRYGGSEWLHGSSQQRRM